MLLEVCLVPRRLLALQIQHDHLRAHGSYPFSDEDAQRGGGIGADREGGRDEDDAPSKVRLLQGGVQRHNTAEGVCQDEEGQVRMGRGLAFRQEDEVADEVVILDDVALLTVRKTVSCGQEEI